MYNMCIYIVLCLVSKFTAKDRNHKKKSSLGMPNSPQSAQAPHVMIDELREGRNGTMIGRLGIALSISSNPQIIQCDSDSDSDGYPQTRGRSILFKNNLQNNIAIQDIMMDDIINHMDTPGLDEPRNSVLLITPRHSSIASSPANEGYRKSTNYSIYSEGNDHAQHQHHDEIQLVVPRNTAHRLSFVINGDDDELNETDYGANAEN